MSRLIPFSKISAAGNDFIIIDNRKKVLPRNLPALARRWCRRKLSVGADGMLVLEASRKTHFRMRYFNADGSVAAMCGNGGRSIARFAYNLGAAPKNMVFETDAGLVRADILGSAVRLWLYEPREARLDFPLKVEKREFDVSFINTGVPHTVIFVNDIEQIDVHTIGRMVRFHREFAPDGTNVDFVQKINEHTIAVRTYERGVEDETLACGTGVTASAIVAGLRGMVQSPVICMTRGGDALRVSFHLNDQGDFLSPVSKVSLQGPAEVTFQGELAV